MNGRCATCRFWDSDCLEPSDPEWGSCDNLNQIYPQDEEHPVQIGGADCGGDPYINTRADFGCVLWEKK